MHGRYNHRPGPRDRRVHGLHPKRRNHAGLAQPVAQEPNMVRRARGEDDQPACRAGHADVLPAHPHGAAAVRPPEPHLRRQGLDRPEPGRRGQRVPLARVGCDQEQHQHGRAGALQPPRTDGQERLGEAGHADGQGRELERLPLPLQARNLRAATHREQAIHAC